MPAETPVPYAMFRTHDGRTVKVWTKQQYDYMASVARVCRCGRCDCCRALEYVTEVTDAR